ncbi:Ribonuclease H-like protein [Gracilaria domingensis]|nr:Ribonuclease H-like protein [Gracilaria domingensis]
MYHDKLAKKRYTKENGDFKPLTTQLAPEINALYDYILLIVFNRLPISIVESPRFRSFSNHETEFSENKVAEIIIKLRKLVKDSLSEELNATKRGSIMHGEWSWNGVHYIGLFASYLTPKKMQLGGPAHAKDTVRLVLLSCSPIANAVADDSDKSFNMNAMREEAVTFTAETRAEHIKSMFTRYGIDFSSWVVCHTAVNCSVNRKLSNLLGVPLVACKSDLLNMEVNSMVEKTADLEKTFQCVQKTMDLCKRRLRSRVLLRELANLNPVARNKTGWSGKYRTLNQFLRIRDELMMLGTYECSQLALNVSTTFKDKVERYCKQLAEITQSKMYLQKFNVPLGECQDVLRMLTEEVEAGFDNDQSPFYRCVLQKSYIATDASILTDPLFESSVCKIQRGEAHLLSIEEKKACEILRVPNNEHNTTSELSEGFTATYEERLRQRKRRKIREDEYFNCDFIFGSTTQVERLKFAADCHLPDRMTSLLFEAVTFLRINDRFWNIHTVNDAYQQALMKEVIHVEP